MALKVTLDVSKTPLILTIQSDRRIVSGTVVSQGETAPYAAVFPVTINDDAKHVWTFVSDDGKTAVYSY